MRRLKRRFSARRTRVSSKAREGKGNKGVVLKASIRCSKVLTPNRCRAKAADRVVRVSASKESPKVSRVNKANLARDRSRATSSRKPNLARDRSRAASSRKVNLVRDRSRAANNTASSRKAKLGSNVRAELISSPRAEGRRAYRASKEAQ